jgi:hypothetical protein
VFIDEEDWGGFATGLNQAIVLAAPLIKAEGAKALAEAGDGGDWWQVLVQVALWVFDQFADFLVDVFADDLFAPGTAVAGLHTLLGDVYKKRGGWENYQSGVGEFTFKGHGGHYRVRCVWKISTRPL